MNRTRKMIIAGSMLGAVVFGTASAAMAAGDTDDHYNVAAGTTVTGTGSLTGSGVLGGISISISCPVTAKGKTPATGLTVKVPAANISFGGANSCTVTSGGATIGTATIVANGTWKIAEVDKDGTAGENATEPNSGDKAKITIPFVPSTSSCNTSTGVGCGGGAQFQSSLAAGCIVYIGGGPNATSTSPVVVNGSYNDAGNLSIPNTTITVNPQNCPNGTSSTASFNSTLTLSPAIFDVS